MENYYKGIKNMHWRKDGFFNKWWWENQTATYEKKKKKKEGKKLDYYLIPYIKINSK